MTITSQGGVLGFGPQFAKSSTVNNWFYHRVLDSDMGVADMQNAFPPEVGGRPFPAGAYKDGVMVGGGMTMHPRLQNSVGWLLYALLGNCKQSQPALVYAGTLAATALAGDPATINTGITNPPAAAKLCVRIIKKDPTPFTGVVTITQTTPDAITETFDFSNGPSTDQRVDGLETDVADNTGFECIVGANPITTIDSIALPAGDTSVFVEVGYEDAVAFTHDFQPDTTYPNKVGWMGVRKCIPGSDGATWLGETYQDCKIINAILSLPNNGPIGMRADLMGRTYTQESDPSWAHNVAYEQYSGVPIASVIGGTITIPQYDTTPMRVVSTQLSFVNAPLDARIERDYGSPFIGDVTVTSRLFSVDMIVKWINPDLYRSILGNSKVATTWSSIPFTSRIDVTTIAPGLMAGSMLPYGLRVQVQQAMLGVRGAITLAGNNAVLMRLVGNGIDVGGDYARYSLTNLQSSYTWPTS